MPPTMGRHGAEALKPPQQLAAATPAVVFVDCADADAAAELRRFRAIHGAEHYAVAVLREFSAKRFIELIGDGANDGASHDELANPGPIIERARAQTSLLALARNGATDFRGLQGHTDGMSQPVFFKDANGAYAGCNRVFERFLGIDRGSVVGQTVFDVAPFELALVYHKADIDLLSQGGMQNYTTHVRNGDGNLRLVRFYKGIVHDGNGRVAGVVGAIHDIDNPSSFDAARIEIDEITHYVSNDAGRRGRFPSSADEDRRLLDRVIARDPSALARLYQAYRRRLARFLGRFTWKAELIDEVINDTFLIVWRRAHEFRGEASISTWIISIAYRTALHALRDERRWDFEPLERVDTIVQYWHDHELPDLLSKALDLLPEEHRLVMTLAYVLGHSIDEIAQITRTPVTTVKARLHRAKGKLRQTLAQFGLGK
ncbi:sigma-70 family RNA polymerase sigma factor [Trinickia caryophylli]|uniref:RNA polymerase sigma factor, sigma-70 family n=1 Tax=Trinickia caryophylli TaxID=28094 RepID=A0A1X7EHR0_TRICW|nr:RNA polymerase sigma factor [Trinickia caryophylli]WQE14317.1 sigma-70 family RNA polymerase sigma factor [Trinickia caryophylli]GLU32300.1 hypothetical protein Busp01_21420 [Trinickia caryophylli]SMF34036.1 RNA polymerase sigma factor, sigma-70 family [Trinickia caryophylli]